MPLSKNLQARDDMKEYDNYHSSDKAKKQMSRE